MTLARIARQISSASTALIGLVMTTAVAQTSGTHQQVPTARRPATSVFQSEPGTPRPLQIAFDPRTGLVTVTLSVDDPEGYLIPNLRPEHFAIYEDGVLQKNATVDIDHAVITMSVLFEGGGRYQELNRMLQTDIPSAAHPLLDALIPADKVAVFSYANTLKMLADTGQPRERIETLFSQLQISGFSEANLYDALVDTLNRTRHVPGRRALLLISTGLDTFSHATFDDVIATAERADTPVYSIGLAGRVLRTIVDPPSPLSKIDWSRANNQLKTLAQVSNGRTYLRDTLFDMPAIYDDLMEHLRVRYVIRYPASGTHGNSAMRRVRVSLIDPRTGGPLRVTDAAGKAITAQVSADASYTP